MQWILWALMLLLQNASFTWVSRARNSKNVGYHATAAFFSNLTYILNLSVGVNMLTDKTQSLGLVATFYTIFTMLGSIGMHWFSMHYLEHGTRKVGS